MLADDGAILPLFGEDDAREYPPRDAFALAEAHESLHEDHRVSAVVADDGVHMYICRTCQAIVALTDMLTDFDESPNN